MTEQSGTSVRNKDKRNGHVKTINKGRGKERQSRKAGPRTEMAMSFLLLLAGSFLIAASFNIFLVPLGIASGGVSGISILVNRVTGFPPAYTQWIINVPLFFLGLWLLGKRFALKTALGSFLLPLLVLLTSHFKPLTDNAMLAALYGGIGVGAGLGLVFRGRSSTGGLDLAAQLLHRYTGMRLGLSRRMLRWHRNRCGRYSNRTRKCSICPCGLVCYEQNDRFCPNGLGGVQGGLYYFGPAGSDHGSGACMIWIAGLPSWTAKAVILAKHEQCSWLWLEEGKYRS